jgi:O-succinylhomoserine sulfhydrylase
MTDSNPSENKWRQATRMVRGGTQRSAFGETSEAIFMTSGFVYDNAEQARRAFKGEEDRFIYSRFSNPTVGMFEQRMALLEGAAIARGTATGMAAVFASLACQLKAGDRLVSSRALFGSCHYIVTDILPRFGIETVLVDGKDIAEWKRALAFKTAAVFMESPSNPTLEIIDIKAVAALAHKTGARVVVDNVFATPVLQKPLEMGADIVVYSTTKHLDGQGRSLGGAIVTDDEDYVKDLLTPFLRHTGPAMSPFNAWLVLKGIETLELRIRQHCANAVVIAGSMGKNTAITKVLYPGLESHPQYALAKSMMAEGGTVITFEIAGGQVEAFKFIDGLAMIDISNNLGDAKSLVTHPATTTHQRLTYEERLAMGIKDNTVRLSVGLEDPADVIDDLEQALGRLHKS